MDVVAQVLVALALAGSLTLSAVAYQRASMAYTMMKTVSEKTVELAGCVMTLMKAVSAEREEFKARIDRARAEAEGREV